MAVADKNTFCIHWSLIKLKNVTINSIQFITFGTDTRGGFATGGAHNQMTCVFRTFTVSYKRGLRHVTVNILSPLLR